MTEPWDDDDDLPGPDWTDEYEQFCEEQDDE